MKKINNQRVLLSEARDIPCLRFLWRWKAVSTFSLCKKFFDGASLHTGYKRLLRLEKAGFIQSKTDSSGVIYVWTLSQKGFLAIRHFLPPLKEEGYKSEHLIHDWISSSIHLGNLLVEKSDGVGLISEQELRRVEPEYYPSWVPKSTIHRPDGYTRIESLSKTIALEVELHLKRTKDYELMADFYSTQPIDEVLWVTPRASMADRIRRIVTQADVNRCKHLFVGMNDILENGSKATIHSGKNNQESIGKYFYQSVGSGLEQVPIQLLLNARKSPHKSTESINNRLRGILQVS